MNSHIFEIKNQANLSWEGWEGVKLEVTGGQIGEHGQKVRIIRPKISKSCNKINAMRSQLTILNYVFEIVKRLDLKSRHHKGKLLSWWVLSKSAVVINHFAINKYITPLCCIPETNTMLYVNYNSTEKNFFDISFLLPLIIWIYF